MIEKTLAGHRGKLMRQMMEYVCEMGPTTALIVCVKFTLGILGKGWRILWESLGDLGSKRNEGEMRGGGYPSPTLSAFLPFASILGHGAP